jgi:hypothetical protein
MKLIDLIDYLKSDKLPDLYLKENLDTQSEALLIYMEGDLNIDATIKIFTIEETDDEAFYEKDGIKYEQLFPIEHAIELMTFDLSLMGKNVSNSDAAKRLLEYRIKDA